MREKEIPLPESRDELLVELEKLTGRHFRTHEDVRDFVRAIDAENKSKQARSVNVWRVVKSTTLLTLLILAFVQFYITDALLQVVSLREMTFFVPVKAQELRTDLPVNDRG